MKMISEGVKEYCNGDITKIENYELAIADNTQTWACHHRLETHNSDGEKRLVHIQKKELIELDMYYNRPPEELIFLTNSEHTKLHFTGQAKQALSEEHKQKISKANKSLSKEIKQKVYDSHKKKVLCIETGEIFNSTKDAERYYNTGKYSVSNAANPKSNNKTAGTLPDGTKLHWRYI